MDGAAVDPTPPPESAVNRRKRGQPDRSVSPTRLTHRRRLDRRSGTRSVPVEPRRRGPTLAAIRAAAAALATQVAPAGERGLARPGRKRPASELSPPSRSGSVRRAPRLRSPSPPAMPADSAVPDTAPEPPPLIIRACCDASATRIGGEWVAACAGILETPPGADGPLKVVQFAKSETTYLVSHRRNFSTVLNH